MQQETHYDKEIETEAVQYEQRAIVINHSGPQRLPVLENILASYVHVFLNAFTICLANLVEFCFL